MSSKYHSLGGTREPFWPRVSGSKLSRKNTAGHGTCVSRSKKPPAIPSGLSYFCQVRFLCRCARSFFRRLCLLIFAFRRFFSEPINEFSEFSRAARPVQHSFPR